MTVPGPLTDPVQARRVRRFWPLISGVIAVLLAAAIGLIIALRDNGAPTEIDTDWMDEIIEHRSPIWTVPSLFMNYLGGGIVGVFVVPIAVIVALLLFRRRWAALYFLIASVLSAGLVQLLKATFGRARPSEILVSADFGSFPSGHTANAATIAVCLAIVFPRVWVWAAGAAYVVLMLLSRTYLGAHWLTDTLAGMLIGAGVAVIVWAPFAVKLWEERAKPHRFVWAKPRASTSGGGAA
ncbi:phosphatase PAP2 family protein [Subtercola endophyticus]|uniref:phosphatase PAP2 family protein n=1 Tax=Subtercola endophyticus TaxID=2895559 RepID=UPI001E372D1D|nr:phosphatase PAP2 family protein [Subtercola endophyticus]UFS57913.1 phosphatase PAP2 family protein [Subtercola endophyticus]